jgi:hypothetical protein
VGNLSYVTVLPQSETAKHLDLEWRLPRSGNSVSLMPLVQFTDRSLEEAEIDNALTAELTFTEI